MPSVLLRTSIAVLDIPNSSDPHMYDARFEARSVRLWAHGRRDHKSSWRYGITPLDLNVTRALAQVRLASGLARHVVALITLLAM